MCSLDDNYFSLMFLFYNRTLTSTLDHDSWNEVQHGLEICGLKESGPRRLQFWIGFNIFRDKQILQGYPEIFEIPGFFADFTRILCRFFGISKLMLFGFTICTRFFPETKNRVFRGLAVYSYLLTPWLNIAVVSIITYPPILFGLSIYLDSSLVMIIFIICFRWTPGFICSDMAVSAFHVLLSRFISISS